MQPITLYEEEPFRCIKCDTPFASQSTIARISAQLAGGVGLVHPPHFPEPECGWFIFDGFTGKGIAVEAGRAMIDHTFATTDLPSIVSYIGERNAASLRVAQRLGALPDPEAQAPEATGTLVYRHTRNSAQRSVS